ncbi:MAG: glycine cleavage system protein R [Chromatiales bacterium]|nr:glycine cleavage system protein R [Chromatiales bacterium]
MSSLLVISALGDDRPGIVQSLSRAILENGCNIEDSRMSVLGGSFAVIILVSGQWNTLAKLEGSLPALGEKLGLSVTTRRTEPRKLAGHMLSYSVDVISLDHPGIVNELATFFSQRGINIQDMATSSYSAAHTATPMFAVRMTVEIPSNLHIAALRDEFLDLCDRLNLDGVIEPLKG